MYALATGVTKDEQDAKRLTGILRQRAHQWTGTPSSVQFSIWVAEYAVQRGLVVPSVLAKTPDVGNQGDLGFQGEHRPRIAARSSNANWKEALVPRLEALVESDLLLLDGARFGIALGLLDETEALNFMEHARSCPCKTAKEVALFLADYASGAFHGRS
jgi:hypothetical protein